MSEILTPPQWILKHRKADKKRMDELEARIERLERHYHNTSPSTDQTGKMVIGDD